MENSNSSKSIPVIELLKIWGFALVGGIGGSVVIGIVGVLWVIVSYPNAEFEHGAAIVGAIFGSVCSIPIGILAGGTIGVLIFNLLSNRNAGRPALSASASALVIGTFVSGIVLAPMGFIFFGLGHI